MRKTSGLAVASMVLGIISACISFMPVINQLTFIIGLLAIIFGIVALVKRMGTGQAIAGVITGVFGIVISVVLIATITAGLNNVTEALDNVSKNIEEKQNKIHRVTYKITSEKPVKVRYGSSKDSKEDTAVGAWEQNGEFQGTDYVSLSTSPEDFLDSEGFTTCEIIVNGESEAKEERSSGFVSCSFFGKW